MASDLERAAIAAVIISLIWVKSWLTRRETDGIQDMKEDMNKNMDSSVISALLILSIC